MAFTSGGHSFGVAHLAQPLGVKLARQRLQKQLDTILDNEQLSSEAREQRIIGPLVKESETQDQDVLKEALAAHNPLAHQVVSGSRGNAANLSTLLASDLLYVDHRNRPQPLPVLRSLTSAEYFAGASG